MKLKSAYALVFLISFTTSSQAIEDDDFHSLNDFTDLVLATDQLTTVETQLRQEIRNARHNITELMSQQELTNTENVYLQNYSIINAEYAEFLLDEYCIEPSLFYQKQAEQGYLYLLKLDSSDRYAMNNLSLFYAQMSVYYRKNIDFHMRLNYLKKAEKLAEALTQCFPANSNYSINYYAILSDQLDLLQKYHRDLNEQQRMMEILKKPLFFGLKNPHSQVDSGNFIILAQQYFKHLYAKNPAQAEEWLKKNQKNIENFVHLNRKKSSREYQFMAELYAMLNEPHQALVNLNKMNASDHDATEPKDFNQDPNFANIRLYPKFQQWLKKYTIDYEKNKNLNPEICKLPKEKLLEINRSQS